MESRWAVVVVVEVAVVFWNGLFSAITKRWIKIGGEPFFFFSLEKKVEIYCKVPRRYESLVEVSCSQKRAFVSYAIELRTGRKMRVEDHLKKDNKIPPCDKLATCTGCALPLGSWDWLQLHPWPRFFFFATLLEGCRSEKFKLYVSWLQFYCRHPSWPSSLYLPRLWTGTHKHRKVPQIWNNL